MSNKNVKHFDFLLFAYMVALIIIGIIMISSATKTQDYVAHYDQKQFMLFLVGLVLMGVVIYMDYNFIGEFYKYIYVINLVALLMVRLIGDTRLGAQRWIVIGPINIQPSEFAKLCIILSLAKFIDMRVSKLNTIKELAKIALFFGVPMLLILKQPDLGTSLVFIAIAGAMVFVSGMSVKYMFGTIVAIGAVLPLMWFKIMDKYQKDRIKVFLDPNYDVGGLGYQVHQSKIAIGSGRVVGKGLYHGGFIQSNYLPEKHTDFIFGVIGEELGFVGSALVIILLILLVLRILKIANEAKDLYGKLICVGVASMIGFQLLENTGMTLGVMPAAGIPLPFITSGVSSLWLNMMSIALVLNVDLRKKKLKF